MFSLRLDPKFSSFFARITVVAFCYVVYSSTATALVPSTIYVSEGIYSTSPYSFFENSDLTGDLYITSGGADTLLISETYTFVKNTSSVALKTTQKLFQALLLVSIFGCLFSAYDFRKIAVLDTVALALTIR